MKHTPGKWALTVNDFGHVTSVKTSEKTICVMRVNDAREGNANAKLIFAAPDMLEVLETIENDKNQIPEWLWSRIKNAINKATL